MLLGRDSERETLDRLLADVRGGASRALVFRGEAGVGKTALLQYAIESASGFRVARAVGVEPEMELAFAALQQLCAPMLDRLERLPSRQRDALGTAFGLRAGDPPDRFLVALAVLGLLSEVAREQPLLCVVDDAQWLDGASAQALAFVARRLVAQSVGVVFATREPNADGRGLPELVVEGLRDRDAEALLVSAVRRPLDDRVRDRIVAETHGNPLALLELPRGLSPAELAGGFGLPDALPLSGRIEESFRRRLAALPAETQRLLLVAAAESAGEPAVVWRAADRLGIGIGAARAAVADGLAEFGARVRFRHPLVRSAAYRAAAPAERRTVHLALVEAIDPEIDPDRRAWHRAHAATGPDEEVAAELERSARRAVARGGVAAAAAFLERATALSVEPAPRGDRALLAARAKYMAGDGEAALEQLASAEAGTLDELQRARAELLRAQVTAASSRGRDAPPLLLDAARRLEPLDLALARETYLETLAAAIFAGPLARGGGLLEAAQAARAVSPAPGRPRPADLLLDGLAQLITEGYAAGAPTLKRALVAFGSDDISAAEGIRWLWLACQSAMDLWDDESWDTLSSGFVKLARDLGVLAVLPIALSARVGIVAYSGELAEAAAMVEELDAVTAETGSQLAPYGALAVAAWRGREAEANELIDANIETVIARGEGVAVGIMHWTRAFFHNGAGRFDDALAAAEQAVEYPVTILFARWGLIELIEAAARSGNADRAAAAVTSLAETTRAGGTDWALGIEARSRALISEGAAAERLYREAIDRLERTRIRVELARAHLVYGEWLARGGRRADARAQVRTAREMFAAMGSEAFAGRIARELPASRTPADGGTGALGDHLTAREEQIAKLAAEGLSNSEIGNRLFLSPRTVEYHLHKVFGKLAVTSRSELDRALPR